MALFLAGAGGLGKSHWIRTLAQENYLDVQGFLTYFQKLFLGREGDKPEVDGEVVHRLDFKAQGDFWEGHCLVGQSLGGFAHETWYNKDASHELVKRKEVNQSAFTILAQEVYSRLKPMHLTVFDELGFFEKDANVFQEFVLKTFHGPYPLVGVMKENCEQGFLRSVATQKNIRLFHVREDNLAQMRDLLVKKLSPLLSVHLDLSPGMYAFIGGGGKTSSIYRLAAEYAAQNFRVAVVPSTKMGVPEPDVDLLSDRAAWETYLAKRDNFSENESSKNHEKYQVIGSVVVSQERQKLVAPDFVSWNELKASFDYVLVEADGTRGLPLKIHASYEPVIPSEVDLTIGLFGLTGLGMPMEKALHRYQLEPQWLEEGKLKVLTAVKLLERYPKVGLWLCNQVDALEDVTAAQELAAALSQQAAVFLIAARAGFPVYEKWEKGKCIY